MTPPCGVVPFLTSMAAFFVVGSPRKAWALSGVATMVPATVTSVDGGAHHHKVPDHVHNLEGRLAQGNFNSFAPIDGLRYSVKDDNKGWKNNKDSDPHHIQVGGGDNDEGQPPRPCRRDR